MKLSFQHGKVVFENGMLYIKVRELIYFITPSKLGWKHFPEKLWMFRAGEEEQGKMLSLNFFIIEEGSTVAKELTVLADSSKLSVAMKEHNLSSPFEAPQDVLSTNQCSLAYKGKRYWFMVKGMLMSCELSSDILDACVDEEMPIALIVTNKSVHFLYEGARYTAEQSFLPSVRCHKDREKGFTSVFFVTDGKSSLRMGLNDRGEVFYGARPNIFYASKKD